MCNISPHHIQLILENLENGFRVKAFISQKIYSFRVYFIERHSFQLYIFESLFVQLLFLIGKVLFSFFFAAQCFLEKIFLLSLLCCGVNVMCVLCESHI